MKQLDEEARKKALVKWNILYWMSVTGTILSFGGLFVSIRITGGAYKPVGFPEYFFLVSVFVCAGLTWLAYLREESLK